MFAVTPHCTGDGSQLLLPAGVDTPAAGDCIPLLLLSAVVDTPLFFKITVFGYVAFLPTAQAMMFTPNGKEPTPGNGAFEQTLLQ